MFTGLIESTGRLTVGVPGPDGGRIEVQTSLGPELAIGDSVAVNGVCLTAVAVTPTGFAADVSPQTIRVTTAGDWRTGARVNLERPLRADARLGGHFVLGHVDAIARLLLSRPEGGSYWLEFSLPESLAKYVIPKGSIAVDGISLTVAELGAAHFAVQIIPHTWGATTLSDRAVGDAVNLEADVLGKHVARLVELGRTV
ncbi:MAG: riboflavin synthase [Acidobacteria bacterium]|nr:riboflavin synthase [Acidobacteriota bacterium]